MHGRVLTCKITNKGEERSFKQYPSQLKSYCRWWHVCSNLKEFRATLRTVYEFYEGALCDKHFCLCSTPVRTLINLYHKPHFLIFKEVHKVLVNLYKTFHIPFFLENLTYIGLEKQALKTSQSLTGDESKRHNCLLLRIRRCQALN